LQLLLQVTDALLILLSKLQQSHNLPLLLLNLVHKPTQLLFIASL